MASNLSLIMLLMSIMATITSATLMSQEIIGTKLLDAQTQEWQKSFKLNIANARGIDQENVIISSISSGIRNLRSNLPPLSVAYSINSEESNPIQQLENSHRRLQYYGYYNGYYYDHGYGYGSGAIAGIIIAGIVFLCLVGLLISWACSCGCCRKKESEEVIVERGPPGRGDEPELVTVIY